jgi:hypothetical protein
MAFKGLFIGIDRYASAEINQQHAPFNSTIGSIPLNPASRTGFMLSSSTK